MTVPGKTPKTDAQWALKVEQRLRELEATGPTRVGSWVISEVDGQLIATKPGQTHQLTSLDTSATAAPAPFKRQLALVSVVSEPAGFTNQFSLSYRGQTTPLMTIDSTHATDIETALVALFVQFTALDFNVTGVVGGPWTIAYPGAVLQIGQTTTTSSLHPPPVMTCIPVPGTVTQ
jgi:hypothetical protein